MKHFTFVLGAVLLALLFVACGSSTGGSAYGSAPSTSNTPAPAATSSTPQALIHTTSATVGGKSETILTNAQGMTLYYYTPDTATQAACSGGCAGNWPPLLSGGASTVSSSTSLSGTLSVASTANGAQVEYNGHPLYTYVQDTAAGQVTGQNASGKWFVATPSLTVQSGSSTKTSGYGY